MKNVSKNTVKPANKVENVENVVELPVENIAEVDVTVKGCINAIKGNAVTEEHLVAMKQIAVAAMQKFLVGEAMSADEITINGYLNKQMQQAKRNAETYAEREAKAAEQKAVFAREMQEHKIAVGVAIGQFIKGVAEATKDMTATDAGKVLRDFIATLPKEPKQATKGGGKKGTGTGTRNEYSPVTHIKDGSTNAQIRDFVVENPGCKKTEIVAALVKLNPKRKANVLKLLLGRAIGGQLPQLVQNGDSFTWEEAEQNS